LLLCATTAVIGAAASLGFATQTVGAARVTPARCTAAGLSVTPTLVGTTWTSVAVGGLPASCGGATLQLTVNTGTTNSGGSAVVPAGGGTVSVTLAVSQAVTAVMQTDLVLTGP
ncbi:MAG: hypothetical protein M3R49_08650, partial [Chloroflexota bacterium]|nr:hypothetical protein [Chloroflexota bacterium]